MDKKIDFNTNNVKVRIIYAQNHSTQFMFSTFYQQFFVFTVYLTEYQSNVVVLFENSTSWMVVILPNKQGLKMSLKAIG